MKKSHLGIVVSFLLIVGSYWGVTYTNDWFGYEYFFENEGVSRDHLFGFLSIFFYKHGLHFQDLFHFHVLIIGFFYIMLFVKNKCNPLFLAILILITNYVAMGNQIRYYLAWSVSLVAIYYYANKNFKTYVLLTFIAVLSHFSILLFHLCFFVYYYFLRKQNIRSQVFFVAICNLMIYLVINSNIAIKEQYFDYFSLEQTSSILGGLLNLLPSIIVLFYIYKLNLYMINADIKYRNSSQYVYLYTSSLATSMLLVSGLQTQILAGRMITALLPIWVMFFMVCYKKGSVQIKRYSKLAIIVTLSAFLFWRFIVPILFNINAEYLEESILMLKSYSL